MRKSKQDKKKKRNVYRKSSRRGLILVLLIPMLLIMGCQQTEDPWTIEGDSVYVDNADIYINVTPHTLATSNWVTLEFQSKVFSGNIDFVFGFNTTDGVYPKKAQIWNGAEWVKWNPTGSINRNFAGSNKWYYSTNKHINSGQKYKLRYYLEVPYGASGKYNLGIKPSFETLAEAIANDHLWMLDPWYQYNLNEGLMAYWSLDNSTDNKADLSGNGYNLTKFGAPTIIDGGLINEAWNYTANGHYHAVPRMFLNDSFTVTLWSKRGVNSSINYLYTYNIRNTNIPDANSSAFELMANKQGNGGKYEGYLYENGSLNRKAESDGEKTNLTNVWNFIALSFDNVSSNLTLYVGNTTDLSNYSYTNYHINQTLNHTAVLGNRQLDTGSEAEAIDEVGVWDRKLQFDEINVLWNSGSGMAYDEYGGLTIANRNIYPTSIYFNSTVNCSLRVYMDEGTTYNVTFNWSNATGWVEENKYWANANNTYISDDLTIPSTLVRGDIWNCTTYAYEDGNQSLNVTRSMTRTVLDYSPTNPTITPTNYSSWFTAPITLGCAGSTDPEGDDFNVTFTNYSGGTHTPLQNSTLTTYSLTPGHYGQDFQWACKVCDNQSICTNTFYSHLILPILSQCDTGNMSVNMSLYNEESINEKLYSNWDLDLILVGESQRKSYNFNINNRTNVSLCLEPNDADVPLHGLLDYVPSANTSYTYNRQYYWVGDLINSNKAWNISVYSIADALATTCQIIITEEGVSPLSGYYIHADRYVPGTGEYHLASTGNTSAIGSDILPLRLTDAWYNLGVYNRDNNSVYQSGKQHIPSCPVRIQVGSPDAPDFNESEEWFEYDNIVWSITFNSSTNVTELIYNSYGFTTNNCFRVERLQLSGTGRDILYTNCSALDTGSARYNITTPGFYIAKYIAYRGTSWKLIGSLDIDLAEYIATLIGLDGVFLAMLLVGMLAFIGLYSPVASIMLAIVGFVFTRAMGLITLSWGAIIGIVFVGLLLLFKQKGR